MPGTTDYNEAPNASTVYITANFATYSPDLRRRLLAIELILEEARAEERMIELPRRWDGYPKAIQVALDLLALIRHQRS